VVVVVVVAIDAGTEAVILTAAVFVVVRRHREAE
jgi:hypothetical protein